MGTCGPLECGCWAKRAVRGKRVAGERPNERCEANGWLRAEHTRGPAGATCGGRHTSAPAPAGPHAPSSPAVWPRVVAGPHEGRAVAGKTRGCSANGPSAEAWKPDERRCPHGSAPRVSLAPVVRSPYFWTPPVCSVGDFFSRTTARRSCARVLLVRLGCARRFMRRQEPDRLPVARVESKRSALSRRPVS